MKHPVCWYGTEHVQKWVWELIWKGRVQITAWYHPPPALPPRLCPFTFPFTQLDTCQMPLNKKNMKLCLCVMSSHLTWIKIYFLVRKNLIIMWTEYLVFLVNVNCRWGYILTLAKIVLSPKKQNFLVWRTSKEVALQWGQTKVGLGNHFIGTHFSSPVAFSSKWLNF